MPFCWMSLASPPSLFDLNGVANRLSKNNNSAAIAPMVMQFRHQINMDEVFGTHR